jgi:hypothetical protein
LLDVQHDACFVQTFGHDAIGDDLAVYEHAVTIENHEIKQAVHPGLFEWIPMARPALELVAPHLRPRAVVTCDNTGREDERAAYTDYFAFINDPAQRFRTMTLPFSGGLEMSVRLG